ncbi:MAG TPA: HD domain-containing phosphohydrolase [Thermoleophilia bacterium]|nr:HD domain-containing phosphohydrolase [Thermoleophilia bacterium]
MSDGDPRRRRSASEEDCELVRLLSIALRTAELHESSNAVAETAVSDLYRALRGRLDAVGEVAISTRARYLFVNGERVRLNASDYLHLRYLGQMCDVWTIGGVILLPGLAQSELSSLVFVLSRDRRRSAEILRQRLVRERAVHVEIMPPVDDDEFGGEDLPERTYGACVDVMDELRSSISQNRQISTRRARRVTQAVVDQILADEFGLLALTTIKEFDDNLFTHSANVAILSVALGQRIGLTRSQLGELCLAAFLHDLGKIAVSREILDKPGMLNREELSEIMQHPIHSVHILLNQGHLSQSTLRAIIGGFEHHINYDLSGYPTLNQKSRVTLFGRIITVVDRYDALTTPRVYRKMNLTPHEGIAYLLENSGTFFDPILVKVFVGILGLYPPGTVVGLSDDTVAVVEQPPAPGMPADRPKVRVLRGDQAGHRLDLSLKDDGGEYERTVSGVHNPGNRGQLPAIDAEMAARL